MMRFIQFIKRLLFSFYRLCVYCLWYIFIISEMRFQFFLDASGRVYNRAKERYEEAVKQHEAVQKKLEHLKRQNREHIIGWLQKTFGLPRYPAFIAYLVIADVTYVTTIMGTTFLVIRFYWGKVLVWTLLALVFARAIYQGRHDDRKK
jgi:hypothetical protein